MGWGLNLWSLRMCFFSWKLFCTAHHMKFLKFAQQLVTLSFKNNECSLWLTVLSLMFFAYLLPVSWLHLFYWTVFPSLPWLFPPQNFDSCQVTAPYLCLFFLTSQLSFKAILKPNLNFFLIDSNAADSNPSLHLKSYSTQKPQGSSDIYADFPFLTTHFEPFNSKTISYSSLHSSPSFQTHPVPHSVSWISYVLTYCLLDYLNELMHACMLSHFSHVRLCATPWRAAHQAPLSKGFSRQEYWSGWTK